MTTEIIVAIVEIFGIFSIGWLARHKGYIQEEELGRWSRFVVDFLYPLLVFHSITANFEADRLGELWPLPIIGLGMIVLGAVFGLLFRKGLKNTEPSFIKTFHHFCAINNFGYLPIIIVYNLWGEAGLARLFFLNLGSTIGYWTIGVALLGESDSRKTLRNIMTPSLIALFLALFLSLSGLANAVPDIILKMSDFAGSAAVPCMLILIGSSLYPFPSLQDKRDLAYLTLVRLVLLPLVFVIILKTIPISDDVKNVAMIVALMPAAVSSTILTRRFGGNPDFAARAAVVTTVVSVVTVPCWLWLIEMWG